ncbi:hypothetical protein HDA32_003611 [Spinactinospora alkalitolerans]|uniref:Uncharacterized protein n=1 Tax=Spinactinospora alkalitolerans TaxID=687207 RepID=A0A852TXK8_9ACTN|nr:hypothetical protein [Spinactinospora alkalitolerans]NYE48491.1 hypothetical protein [Spinactinospora alkalitolerans]
MLLSARATADLLREVLITLGGVSAPPPVVTRGQGRQITTG